MTLDTRWERARAHQNAGNYDAAVAEYEAIVASDPRQPAAWLAIAKLAQRGGSFRVVVDHLRIAAAAVHEAGDWRDLAEICEMLCGLGEGPLVRRAILEADWSDPVVEASAPRLAACLGRIGSHVDSLPLIDNARSRGVCTAELALMRATILRHLGRSAEATAEYQRTLELAPTHALAMLMFATHNRRANAATQVARIRKALEQCPPGAPDLPTLCYALFHHLDPGEDPAAAWQVLMRGVEAKRRALRWDPAQEQARDAAVMRLCDASFVEAADPPVADHVPIFIVGMPRSGTTVLERILGNHSLVASAGELNDFHLQLSWQADVLTDELAHPRLLRACPVLDFGSVGRGYLQRTSWRVGGKRFLVDKMPRNFIYAGLIHKALPQARIICLVRDPMDSVFSNLKELFAHTAYPYSYDPLEAAGHYLRFRQMLQHWDEVMPGVVLTIRYEDLVREPARVARQVMDHCGLPFEPECVDLERNITPSATASSSQVREPVHTRGIGAWRRYAGQLEGARALLAAALPQSAFAAPP